MLIDLVDDGLKKALMPDGLCKRLVINAGIKNVVVRDDSENYRILDVEDWIKNDESLDGTSGY